MKVIIIGAGTGKRIGEFAKKIPKSLLKINGKTILERQVSLFKKNNLNKIIVVTGPNKEKFDLKDISYVFDSKYSEHDILGSLMEARNFFNDELIVTYSDIIYDETVLQQILESKSDIGRSGGSTAGWRTRESGGRSDPSTSPHARIGSTTPGRGTRCSSTRIPTRRPGTWLGPTSNVTHA